LYKIEYHVRANGECPIEAWLQGLENSDKAEHRKIMAKLFKLQIEGLKLVNTEMMSSIKNVKNMFELRGGSCRILTYYDEKAGEFILLHGFRKKHRVEPKEIDVGCRLMNEYLECKYGGA
jgi:hypothetical protein